jgi:hypothetical protein
VTPHFYADTTCVYCGAAAERAGDQCEPRAALERDWSARSGQPYNPIAHLRGEAGRRGARLDSADSTEHGTVRSVFRVVRDGRVLAEASAVVAETAARACLVALTRVPQSPADTPGP